MSDKIKTGEIGREFRATFADGISDITLCRFFLKHPNSTSEVELSPSSFTELGETGYRYYFVSGDFDVPGEYTMEVYIETAAYRGRRENLKFIVYEKNT